MFDLSLNHIVTLVFDCTPLESNHIIIILYWWLYYNSHCHNWDFVSIDVGLNAGMVT